MRFLGLDYGKKRIGIALSDEEGKIAFPHKVFYNKDRVLMQIKSLAEKEKIFKIIIGLPTPFAGGDNLQTLEVKNFANKLKEKIKLPVDFENEILTSKLAHRGSTKEKIDASAAAIILQSYLDKQSQISH